MDVVFGAVKAGFISCYKIYIVPAIAMNKTTIFFAVLFIELDQIIKFNNLLYKPNLDILPLYF